MRAAGASAQRNRAHAADRVRVRRLARSVCAGPQQARESAERRAQSAERRAQSAERRAEQSFGLSVALLVLMGALAERWFSACDVFCTLTKSRSTKSLPTTAGSTSCSGAQLSNARSRRCTAESHSGRNEWRTNRTLKVKPFSHYSRQLLLHFSTATRSTGARRGACLHSIKALDPARRLGTLRVHRLLEPVRCGVQRRVDEPAMKSIAPNERTSPVSAWRLPKGPHEAPQARRRS